MQKALALFGNGCPYPNKTHQLSLLNDKKWINLIDNFSTSNTLPLEFYYEQRHTLYKIKTTCEAHSYQ